MLGWVLFPSRAYPTTGITERFLSSRKQRLASPRSGTATWMHLHGCCLCHMPAWAMTGKIWWRCVYSGRKFWSSSGLGGSLPASRHSGLAGRPTNSMYSPGGMCGSPKLLCVNHLRNRWHSVPCLSYKCRSESFKLNDQNRIGKDKGDICDGCVWPSCHNQCHSFQM